MFIKEGKTNIKYLLIVVILGAIVGGGILWCTTKQEVPPAQLFEIKKLEIKIPDTPIIYSKGWGKEEGIWLFNPATEERKEIIKTVNITDDINYGIYSYSLSSDKKKVAYILDPQCAYGKPIFIRLFNLITDEDKLLVSLEGKIRGRVISRCITNVSMDWIDSWSLNDKYLMIEWTQELEDDYFYKIINTTTGEVITDFKASDFSWLDFMWLNDEELLYQAVHVTISKEGTKPRELMGIEAVNLKGEKRILQKATELKEYYIEEVLADGRIKFSLLEVESSDNWDNENLIKTAYWTMNQEGKDLVQISESEYPKIKDLLSEEITSNYMKTPLVFKEKSLSKNKDWVLFTMTPIQYAGPQAILEEDIFIINLNNKESLIKIDSNHVWGKPDW